MEFCDGGSLSDAARKRRLTHKKAGQFVSQILKGLAFAHENDFVHRDIKPQNILLRRQDGRWKAKLGDFGLAKNFQRAGFSGMTATGSYAGTYNYMPREQLIDFKRTQPVSDIWSLGACLYHLLTRKYPRDFEDDRHPTDVILEGGIVPVRERDARIPAALAEVVDCAISDEIEERFQTAVEMREALIAALSDLPD